MTSREDAARSLRIRAGSLRQTPPGPSNRAGGFFCLKTSRGPVRAVDRPLLMPIENVFTIEGRGTVVTGKIGRGTIRAGDTVDIVGLGGVDMAMPGDGVKLGIRLGRPIALDDGARFAIREGGRTVGSGVVTKVLA